MHIIGVTTCPAIPNGEGVCNARMEKSQAYGDALGFYWCPEHEKRGRLLNYGSQNHYPMIVFQSRTTGMRYAIGNGHDEDLWKVAALMGSTDMINAAYDAVFGSSGEEEL